MTQRPREARRGRTGLSRVTEGSDRRWRSESQATSVPWATAEGLLKRPSDRRREKLSSSAAGSSPHTREHTHTRTHSRSARVAVGKFCASRVTGRSTRT